MNDSDCKVAFLDRDGTINVDHGYVFRTENWELTELAAEGIVLLRDAGFQIAVVTNQSGVATGKYSKADVLALHAYMRKQLDKVGARIDAVAFCQHGRNDNCNCRKPKGGLAAQIAAQLCRTIDFQSSWTIGDKTSDVGFGVAVGTRTALIRSEYWTVDQLTLPPTFIADTLFEAAQQITSAN